MVPEDTATREDFWSRFSAMARTGAPSGLLVYIAITIIFSESIAKGSSVRSPAEKIHRVKYIE